MHITAFNNIIYGNTGGSNLSSEYGSANVYISTTNAEYAVSHSILGGVDEDEFDTPNDLAPSEWETLDDIILYYYHQMYY